MLSSKIILSLSFALIFAKLCSSLTCSPGCPASFVSIHSKCYYIGTAKTNWYKAFRQCRQLNAELLTIDEEYERRLLTDHLRKSGFEASWPNSFWTSGTQLGEPSNFYWQSSGATTPMGKWLWHIGEPNNPKIEQCVSIYYANGGYFANDAPCDYAFMYICQRPLIV